MLQKWIRFCCRAKRRWIRWSPPGLRRCGRPLTGINLSNQHVLIRWKPVLEFLKKSMGARDRVGIRLWYRPISLYRLAESIPRLLKSLKIAALNKGLLARQNNHPYTLCQRQTLRKNPSPSLIRKHTDKKGNKIFFIQYIGKFRWDRVQSHIWGRAS